MSNIIPRERLDLAAIAVHRILTEKDYKHAFFGGYELQIMGGTKDVDLVVKKPLFNGFEKVNNAFKADSEFAVFEGTKTDAIRAIHKPSGVGIDIMLWDFPKDVIALAGDTYGFRFFNSTDMFIRKIKCLAERMKQADANDLLFLHDNYGQELDWEKIKKKVKDTEWKQKASANYPGSSYPRVHEILNLLNQD